MSVRRRAGRWGAGGFVVVGAALVSWPTTDRMVGDWRQQQLAASADASISRYRSAVSAAYETVVSDYEDSLVSFELGAVPVTADGRRLLSTSQAALDAVGGAPDAPSLADSITPSRPEVQTLRQPSTPPPTRRVFSGAVLRIPKIGLSQAVVDGVDRDSLKDGPGHYPGTALPGEVGNVVVSGHRTTYTKPFLDLDLLESGDEILIDTPDGSFRYLVERSHVVSPDDVGPLEATAQPILTLTTCTPKGSADRRLIVVASLDGQPLEVSG